MNDDKRCMTCAWCEILPAGDASNPEGVCHVSPPTTTLMGSPQGVKSIVVQSLVHVTRDWCSQHETQLVKPVSGLRVEK